jgi:glycerol-3-phosphate cytidylyltransferase
MEWSLAGAYAAYLTAHCPQLPKVALHRQPTCKSSLFRQGKATPRAGQVNMYKPNVPVVPLDQRVEMLEALSCVDIVRPYHELEYVSGCRALDVDIFVVGEDWGSNPHNLDVDAYLRDMGKQISQVTYNLRTSSTRIKQMVMEQSAARNDDRKPDVAATPDAPTVSIA